MPTCPDVVRLLGGFILEVRALRPEAFRLCFAGLQGLQGRWNRDSSAGADAGCSAWDLNRIAGSEMIGKAQTLQRPTLSSAEAAEAL